MNDGKDIKFANDNENELLMKVEMSRSFEEWLRSDSYYCQKLDRERCANKYIEMDVWNSKMLVTMSEEWSYLQLGRK